MESPLSLTTANKNLDGSVEIADGLFLFCLSFHWHGYNCVPEHGIYGNF